MHTPDAPDALFAQWYQRHIDADEPFVREDVSVQTALDRFRGENQPYKVELIDFRRELLRGEPRFTAARVRTGNEFTSVAQGLALHALESSMQT